MKKRLTGFLLCLCMILGAVPALPVHADSSRIVTLGADLSKEQRQTVLDFFGLSEDDLKNIEVLTVNNKEEHETLDGVIAKSIIGSKTYSCAYIEPTTSGGIHIKTANLTYVTFSTLHSALQTAGIDNCNLIVTAPFEVSGTGALTGIYKAYDSQGIELDEDKKQAGVEELILASDMEEEHGTGATQMLSDIKNEVTDEGDVMSEEEIADIIDDKAKEYGVDLNDEEKDRLIDLMNELQNLDYSDTDFDAKLDDIKSTVTEKAEQSEGVLGAISDFFSSIGDFFTNLFGQGKERVEKADSIFDDVDTDVIELDN